MTTDLTRYSKTLTLPADFDPSSRLEFDDVVGHAIRSHDLADDVHGINASLDLIRETRGGRWPARPLARQCPPPRGDAGCPGGPGRSPAAAYVSQTGHR
jgi:hypothetical protein